MIGVLIPSFALAALGATQLCFDEAVPLGDNAAWRYEFRVSTFQPSSQDGAAVALLPDGASVTVWSSRRQNEGRYGVFGQRLDALGVADGSEFRVSLVEDRHALSPDIALGETGAGWAVWQAHGQDGHAGSVIARRFDANLDGGDEILVNQAWRGNQYDPVVAIGPGGDAVFAWTSVDSVKAIPQIRARLISADGVWLSDEIAISSVECGGGIVPSVAFGPGGAFVVAYGRLDEHGNPSGIAVREFGASGLELSPERIISATDSAISIEPAIAAVREGFVVAWVESEADGDDFGIVARRLDDAARPVGAPFVVNANRRGPQTSAAIAPRADGSFLIAWNSQDADDVGVFGQMFDAGGARIAGETRLTRQTAGRQALRQASATSRVAFAADGRLALAWSGDCGSGDSSAANLTLLTPAPLNVAEHLQGIGLARPRAVGTPEIAAGPHVPPTFDPADIDQGERVIGSERGVDFGFDAILNTGWTPPDPHLAVGPTDMVAMTNGRISIFSKAGVQLFTDEIEDAFGFWGAQGATGFVFDPEVIYDEGSQRFIAMAAEAFAPGNRSYVLIAVSDNSSANGAWFKYRFETTALAGNLFDSPNIGVDAQALYVTGDGFGIAANYPVYIYDKASLLVGAPPAITRSFAIATTTQSAGTPPMCYGAGAFLLLEHREPAGSNAVRFIAITDPLGTPLISTVNVTVPAYDPPEDAPQLGSSVRPESFDQRFWSVAYRNGRFWGTHHVNSTRVRARWYEFDTLGWPFTDADPILVQSGEIDPGGTTRTTFSSIGLAANGAVAMSMARSSPTERLSMYTTWRAPCDPLGTFEPGTIQKASTAADGSGRWGDYSAVQPDPAVPNRFWAIHEYTTGSWRTWIAQLNADPCPLVGDLDGDGDVDLADLSELLESFGLCAGDLGYNPDADLDGDNCVGLGDLSALLENFGL